MGDAVVNDGPFGRVGEASSRRVKWLSAVSGRPQDNAVALLEGMDMCRAVCRLQRALRLPLIDSARD
jgi:hypothetical protein